MKNLVDNVEYNNQEDVIFRQLNKNTYSDLILDQCDKVCFQIFELLVIKDLTNGTALCIWERLNNKFQLMSGASMKIIRKISPKNELDYVTKDQYEWITELELLRGNLQSY